MSSMRNPIFDIFTHAAEARTRRELRAAFPPLRDPPHHFGTPVGVDLRKAGFTEEQIEWYAHGRRLIHVNPSPLLPPDGESLNWERLWQWEAALIALACLGRISPTASGVLLALEDSPEVARNRAGSMYAFALAHAEEPGGELSLMRALRESDNPCSP